MLVLSRKKNESIVINNDITVTVVEIRGDKVRLGIVAPKEVPVHRQEVFDAIHGTKPPTAPEPTPVSAPGKGWRVELFDPVTGRSTGKSDITARGGKLRVTLPAFQGSVAVKWARQGP